MTVLKESFQSAIAHVNLSHVVGLDAVARGRHRARINAMDLFWQEALRYPEMGFMGQCASVGLKTNDDFIAAVDVGNDDERVCRTCV